MGLPNVRRRLDTTYRHEASLTVRNEADSTKFEAEIILPFWTASGVGPSGSGLRGRATATPDPEGPTPEARPRRPDPKVETAR